MSNKKKSKELPIVYACPGFSSAAQLANDLAVMFDRDHIAEMSCIAGVGGKVKPLLKTARSGREIIALDGCSLHCVKETLEQENITPDYHFDLSIMGVQKLRRTDYTEVEAMTASHNILDELYEEGLLREDYHNTSLVPKKRQVIEKAIKSSKREG